MNKFTCIAGSLAAASASMPGYGQSVAVNYPFGTTFPMLGTQIHSGNTWEGAVYYGTTMKFNPGMFVSYTNSYNVPVYPPPTTPPPTNQGVQVPTFPSVQTPTVSPTPSMEGSYCTGFSSANSCPASYYCQPKPGYNPYQVGSCTKQKTVNTPHNGGGSDYDFKGPDELQPTVNTRGGSCAPPSACGFQSVTGSCYCDLECEANGDCCFDFDAQLCREEEVVENNSFEEIFDGHLAKPICPGNCDKTTEFKSESGKKCFCDPVCLSWDDCCHDFLSTCGST